MKNNLSYSLIEKANKNNNPITYQDLLKQVDDNATGLENTEAQYNMDEYIALEINYNDNYKKKELEFIAGYYDISKRKKRNKN